MKLRVPAMAFSSVLALSSSFMACADEGDSAPQLVVKQDFELTDSVREWRLHTPADAKAFAVSRDSAPGQAHSGQAALKYEVTSTSEVERYIFSGAKLPAAAENAARNLRVRFYARTAPGLMEQAFTFRVLERDATKPTVWVGGPTGAVKIQPSTEWKEYSFGGTLSAETRGLTLYVMATKPVPGQTVWVDDLSVEVVPVTAP